MKLPGYLTPEPESSLGPLSTLIITDKLSSRPQRAPDYAAENKALVSLAETLANRSDDIFEKLAQHALVLCSAHSAGISLLDEENGQPVFRWRAIHGKLEPFINGTMPRFFSPCGEVVDGNKPILIQNPVLYYHYVADLGIELCEVLLVPFHKGSETVGTLWVVAHDEQKLFVQEDLRCLESLCKFASASVMALQNIQALEATSRRLQDRTEQLAEASQRKDEFLATLSHELRSPLNIIQGHAELLRMETPGTPEFEESLDAIERSTKLQTQMISDMLDVSRIITGKMLLDISVFNPKDIVVDAVRAIQFAADAKSIRLHYDIEAQAGMINGDRGRLQQALWNFLANAVKFSPQGSRVFIQVQLQRGIMVFTVKDQGQGITPEFLPHVFDRFHQEDGSKSRKYGGLGLGLAIVRHIAELHGGSVHATSPGKNQGSTFSLSIPVVAVVDDVHDAAAASHHASPRLLDEPAPRIPAYRILVVDDQIEASSLLKRSLEMLGAEVITASFAEEAWTRLEERALDILISDIGMRDINGLDLIKTWRRREKILGRTSIPAIALTAYGTQVDRAEILDAGFTAHLAKPAGLRELVAIILREVPLRHCHT
jgi:signal transduction histidine kinase/ActR/RegA family two-component response regulator